MAELLEEEEFFAAAEEEAALEVPSALPGRTIPVEGRTARRPAAPVPTERPRAAEPSVKPAEAAGPSVSAVRGPPPVEPPVAAPGAPPVRKVTVPARERPAAEAAAPARAPSLEEKPAKKRLKDTLKEAGRGKGAELLWVLLRFLQLAAFCVSFSVIAASGDNGLYFGDFQAFTFLVAGTVIGATWTLCMLLNELAKLMGRLTRQILITTLDVSILLLVFGAACASAALTTFDDRGARPAYPRGLCQTGIFSKFCSRTKAATAFGFIGFGFLLPSVAWSFYSSAREYIKSRERKERRDRK